MVATPRERLFSTERGGRDRVLVVSHFFSSVIRQHGQRKDPQLICLQRRGREQVRLFGSQV